MNFICSCVLLLIAASVIAQNNQNTDTLANRLPDTCEGNTVRLDIVRQKSREVDLTGVTIAIARLGKGELSSEINNRRLYTARKYLDLPSDSFVAAEGERVQGFGRIELYVGGRLLEVLPVEKCQDLRVGSCDNDQLDTRRYQMPLGKRPRCR